MQTRTTPQLHIPAHCPKCKSITVFDNTWEHGKRVDSWRCPMCGMNGESAGYYEARKRDTVATKKGTVSAR